MYCQTTAIKKSEQYEPLVISIRAEPLEGGRTVMNFGTEKYCQSNGKNQILSIVHNFKTEN
jgi:hypothetical protein